MADTFKINPFTGLFDDVGPFGSVSPLPVAKGGTGLTSYTQGDILFASGATTIGAITDVATGQVLTSGGVGANPVYSGAPTLATSLTVPTVFGSSSASANLNLQSTSNSTRGLVQTVDSFVACTTNLTASGTVQAIDTFTGGVSISTGAAIALTSTSTITMTGNGAAGGYLSFFNVGFTVKDDGTARTTSGCVIFSSHPTYTATIAGGLVLNDLAAIIPAVTNLYCAPTFGITGAGTGTVQNVAGVYSRGTVGAGWTITNWNGLLFDSPANTGTITNMYVVRSTLAAATNRWFLFDSGGAQSSIKGNLRLGDNTAPTALLDIQGTINTNQNIANGSVATVLGSVGPVGSHTTVQEWLKINIGGTTRFLPCF